MEDYKYDLNDLYDSEKTMMSTNLDPKQFTFYQKKKFLEPKNLLNLAFAFKFQKNLHLIKLFDDKDYQEINPQMYQMILNEIEWLNKHNAKEFTKKEIEKLTK